MRSTDSRYKIKPPWYKIQVAFEPGSCVNFVPTNRCLSTNAMLKNKWKTQNYPDLPRKTEKTLTIGPKMGSIILKAMEANTWGGEAERRGAVPEDPVAVDDASAPQLEALRASEADHGTAEVRHLKRFSAEWIDSSILLQILLKWCWNHSMGPSFNDVRTEGGQAGQKADWVWEYMVL